jgi:hypothetical protein
MCERNNLHGVRYYIVLHDLLATVPKEDSPHD